MLDSTGVCVMFTMPLFGLSAFVVDNVLWQANTTLLGVGSTQATSTATFDTDGTVDLNGPAPDQNWYWLTLAGIGSNHWIRATLMSGDMPSGSALNTWLQLSSARAWSLTTTGTFTVRTKQCVLKIEIAADSVGVVILGTNSLDIEATVDNS